ncbi:putative muscle, skeletal receptor tyrosine-protein kinase isoform X2 [Apostichopus japonicus]|uniref:Putative muscle, skeletal receptor tyrosine-protein kinase isoform X2 n=1 Tax=Stichopus japonicus TaxID=307972 RepID=A0A2G8KK76_STIJA|nr:putative muscle, skeletal receptor tyrosine-protein kinase isoform X2 [Apostichopus japonicus]
MGYFPPGSLRSGGKFRFNMNIMCKVLIITSLVVITQWPKVFILCGKSKCPDKLLFDPSQVFEFNCYSDQLKPKSTFTWNVNNVTSKGVTTDTFHKLHGDDTTSIGSTLKTSLHEPVSSVSCSLGDASSVIFAHVTEQESNNGTSTALILITILIIALIVGAFVFRKHKNRVLSTLSRCLNTRKSGRTYQNKPKAQIKRRSRFEYEDIAKQIDLRSFDRKSICFRGNISISPTIKQWSGKVNLGGKEKQDVVISFIQDEEPREAKELWKTCSKVKFAIPEHPNILKMIGYSSYEGIFYLIQDYYGMTSLDFCLVTEYSNCSMTETDLSIDACLGYAYDIVKGMAYLDSHRDAENAWVLPPECTLPNRYTEASDVWGIGFTFWEIFIGDIESLRKYVLLGNDELKNEMEAVGKPVYCPDQLWEAIKLCFSIRQTDRPTIEALNSILQNPSEVEYRDKRQVEDEPLTSTMVNGDIVSDTEIYVDEETAKNGRKDDVYDFEG